MAALAVIEVALPRRGSLAVRRSWIVDRGLRSVSISFVHLLKNSSREGPLPLLVRGQTLTLLVHFAYAFRYASKLKIRDPVMRSYL